jgi:hypothetical protein
MLQKVGRHQVNRCTCGRTIHWHHTANVGDKWVCGNRNCRKVWTLVPHGTPGASSGVMVPSWGHRKPLAHSHRPPASRQHEAQRRRRGASRPQSLLGQFAAFFGVNLD